MTRRERLQENVEDAVFALLMEEVAEQEGKRLLEENERLKSDPSAKVPDNLDRRCRQIIKRSFARERRHEAGRTLHRVLGNVSLAAMVSILLFVTAFAAVPEVRIRTLNLLIEVSDVSTSLHLSETNSDSAEQRDVPNGINDARTLWGYRLPDIPSGYEIEYQNSTDLTANLWYSNIAEDTIKFIITKASDDLMINVDTEDAQVEHIQIHGYDGLLIEKGNRVEVIWGDTDQNNFVSITCTGFDEDTVLRLANDLEYRRNFDF